MPQKTFWRAGHFPTLLAAFLYFDAGSLCWVLLGPLAIQISHVLQLDAAQKGLMVAAPVLAGAFLRVLVGVLVDRYGAKRVGIIAQVLVILGLGAAWLLGVRDFAAVLWLSIVLGLAGASFAVAMPLASRWVPAGAAGHRTGAGGVWAIPAPCWRPCSPRRWRSGLAG